MKTFNVLVLLTILTISSINANNKFQEFLDRHGDTAKKSLLEILTEGKQYYKDHKEELFKFLEQNREKVADFIVNTDKEVDVLIDELAKIIASLKIQKNELLQKYAQKLKEIDAEKLVDRVYAEAKKAKDF